jgi:stress-induced morphogen
VGPYYSICKGFAVASRTIHLQYYSSLRKQIHSDLEAQHIECTDFSDNVCDGAKLDLLVVSSKFEGKPPLARHRLVNTALSDLMNDIHALTIKAWTPAQYEAKKGQDS